MRSDNEKFNSEIKIQKLLIACLANAIGPCQRSGNSLITDNSRGRQGTDRAYAERVRSVNRTDFSGSIGVVGPVASGRDVNRLPTTEVVGRFLRNTSQAWVAQSAGRIPIGITDPKSMHGKRACPTSPCLMTFRFAHSFECPPHFRDGMAPAVRDVQEIAATPDAESREPAVIVVAESRPASETTSN
jgi:hypothetical protein